MDTLTQYLYVQGVDPNTLYTAAKIIGIFGLIVLALLVYASERN